jgi:hypothetical protein
LLPLLAITDIDANHPNSILFTSVAAAWSLTCDIRPTQRSADTNSTVAGSHVLFLMRCCLRWLTLRAAIIILLTSQTTICPSHVMPQPCSSGATSWSLLSEGLNVSIALSA